MTVGSGTKIRRKLDDGGGSRSSIEVVVVPRDILLSEAGIWVTEYNCHNESRADVERFVVRSGVKLVVIVLIKSRLQVWFYT